MEGGKRNTTERLEALATARLQHPPEGREDTTDAGRGRQGGQNTCKAGQCKNEGQRGRRATGTAGRAVLSGGCLGVVRT